jgi:hypothetical protein
MTLILCFKTGGNRADPTCWIAVPRDIQARMPVSLLLSD